MIPLTQIDDHTCLHTCLAMIAGTTVQEVVEWLGSPDRAMNSEEAILYLAQHGIFLATYFYCRDGAEVTEDFTIELRSPLAGHPMLLTVKSQRFPGKLHSVFWTGKEVLDPSPLRKGPQKIEDYEVTEFWPLLVTEKQAEGRGLV
jgi:hypothetical protein